MGLDAIQVGAWNGKKKKEGEDEVTGCWMRFPFIGSCLSSKPKANGSRSGSATSTLYESMSTNDTSKSQPVVPAGSSSTTSFLGSTPSTPNITGELKVSSRLRRFSFNELKSATRNFKPENLLGEGGFGCVYKGWINENGHNPGHKEWLV